MTKEEKGLLDMIAYTEGTLGVSNNGYDVFFGSPYRVIAGWTPTTKIVHGCSSWGKSTAAGRYQFLCSTWKGGTKDKPGPNLPMTKANQDSKGLALINGRLGNTNKTLLAANRNEFLKALNLLSREWSSLPIGTNDFKDSDGNTGRVGYSYYTGKLSKFTPDKCYEVYKKAVSMYK